MDEQVPEAITEGLRLRGVDVLTTQEDHQRSVDDPDLLQRATELRRVMFSQDADMLREATRRQSQGIPFHGVVYAHQLKVTIGQCVHDLELVAQVGEQDDVLNRIIYLPIR